MWFAFRHWSFRLYFFQKILDEVPKRLHGEFASLPYASDKPTSDYYGIHFALPESADVIFSLALFLQSPSSLKLFPFKIMHRGRLIRFNDNHQVIQNYRAALLTLPRTIHKFRPAYPGYVVDLFPGTRNTVDDIAKEVRSLLKYECQEMISIYLSVG